jgi:hypothetical protein
MKEASVLANRELLVDGNLTLRVRHFPLDETGSATLSQSEAVGAW